MQERVNIHATEPKAINSVFALENYVNGIGLDKTLIHLIKVRASVINGCAFCINMHNREAMSIGESMKRLALLSAWKESAVFSVQEEAILQLTDEVTLIHKGGVSEETYTQVSQYFDENEIAQIILVISTINVWNRIAISTHMPLDD